MRVLLFDIDGTLIRTGGAGKSAMEQAFEKIYGIKNGFDGIQMMGRTDPAILLEAANNHGLVLEDEKIEQFKKAYFQFLEEEIKVPRSGKYICPGITALLASLQNQTNLVLGLLTGNWRYSGFLKLHHFGIDGYFTFGAFADDSSRREDLVPVALKRFKEKYGEKPNQRDVYVIGDTPLDIDCARPYGVCTVGVATGFHSLKELKAAEPDYLFEDFRKTEEVIKIFLGQEELSVSR